MRFLTLITLVSLITLTSLVSPKTLLAKETFWQIQSVDTMKYSRDLAREKVKDDTFKSTIDGQVKKISEIGTTHVAIGTPYDPEFVPFLRLWVNSARKYGLKIWFRGNFSGWEGWFDYPKIGRAEHLLKLAYFISKNPDLFENGDILTPCPECENGGPGDPRNTNEIEAYRNFLITEKDTCQKAFEEIKKSVSCGYFSMNGDVAKLIMNRETTGKLGGVVVIDHYVSTPEKLATDIKDVADVSGGKVILGEFGAPIPDIQGTMTEQEQADWIGKTLSELTITSELAGINYWTSVGGSTEIWTDSGYAKKGVSALVKYYIPRTFEGTAIDETGTKIQGVLLASKERNTYTSSEGQFSLLYVDKDEPVNISADGYFSQIYPAQDGTETTVKLVKTDENLFFLIKKFLYNLFN